MMISKNYILEKKETTITKRYDERGLVKELTDIKTIALEFISKKKSIFKVKTNKMGQLYDPTQKSGTYNVFTKNKITSDPMFVLRVTNKKCFDLYVRFLQKRHKSLLIEAERSL